MARRFDAKEVTIYRDLRVVMTKMGATALKVDYDLMGKDPAVPIIFDRRGKRYISECKEWSDFLDNLRAAQLAIEYTYRIGEAYGVSFGESRDQKANQKAQDLFDKLFAALEAPLDPSVLLLGSGNNWWDILGVSRTATKTEIVNAYKALAKVHHPDAGGKDEDFLRLRAAYEMGLKERG